MLSLIRYNSAPHHRHSYPTRRSSDLGQESALRSRFEFYGESHAIRLLRKPDSLRGKSTRPGPVRGCRIPYPPGTGEAVATGQLRSEEHTSELQSRENLVCRLLLEKKK